MGTLRTICVYCGSGPGKSPTFAAAARDFGKILAENKIGLVYGGGSIGLMGELAKSVLHHGGKVTGVIPEFLIVRERMLQQAQELVVTKDMHERKRIMFERSDAFVALPGGIGTLEELVEQLTWAQLGQHKKPILAANIDRFWDPLCALLDHMRELAFIRSDLSVELLVVKRVQDILPRLKEALAAVLEPEKAMTTAEPGRM
ncbi:MAG: TIGR00730 family Rossman fold protein [Xanthobacteraceae bacterium]